MKIIAQVLKALQHGLGATADELACGPGCVPRAVKVSGSTFGQTRGFGGVEQPVGRIVPNGGRGGVGNHAARAAWALDALLAAHPTAASDLPVALGVPPPARPP